MVPVVLDADLSARLAALAQACGVPPETVAVAGTALLLRRYTGRWQRTLRWAGGTVHSDLTGDGPVRRLLATIDETTRPAAGEAPAREVPAGGAPAGEGSFLVVRGE